MESLCHAISITCEMLINLTKFHIDIGVIAVLLLMIKATW